jgi:hypothetical protein
MKKTIKMDQKITDDSGKSYVISPKVANEFMVMFIELDKKYNFTKKEQDKFFSFFTKFATVECELIVLKKNK